MIMASNLHSLHIYALLFTHFMELISMYNNFKVNHFKQLNVCQFSCFDDRIIHISWSMCGSKIFFDLKGELFD